MSKTRLAATFILGLFNLLISHQLQAKDYQLQHLEPAFWWTGMQSNQLQLLVHGEDIADLTPVIAAQGMQIQKVHRVSNNNYLFIDVALTNDLAPSTYQIDFKQGDTIKLSYGYQIKAKNPAPAAANSFSGKDVIYLLTPDRFANGDPSNDSSPLLLETVDRSKAGGRHGGDIQGIIDQLGYLADLGITQLWPNPMVENNMADYSYHGYAATDFYQIDARFGSNALYRELATQARQHGIGLIKDVVLNHIGSNHWWLKDMPMADWLNSPDEFHGTNHQRESLLDPHAVASDQQSFSDGWFVPTMPDLNQRNAFVANYLMQNTLWWIEYANLSGLRVDTYSYSDKTFLTQWTKRITDEYPNINIVGEEWSVNPAIVSYWQRGKNRSDGYQSYVPSMMDFPLQQALPKALLDSETWGTGLVGLYRVLANDFQYADADNLVIFADNHDMSRIFTQLHEDVALFKMAMVYLATTRGIPQILYGTEILMTNTGTEDHGIIRTDFPGGWLNDKVNGFSGAALTEQQTQAQQFVAKLLNWRKTASAIHFGKLKHYAVKDGVYSYFRYNEQQKLLISLNKNDTPITLNKQDFSELITDELQATNVLTGEQRSLSQPLSVPAKSAVIWQLY